MNLPNFVVESFPHVRLSDDKTFLAIASEATHVQVYDAALDAWDTLAVSELFLLADGVTMLLVHVVPGSLADAGFSDEDYDGYPGLTDAVASLRGTASQSHTGGPSLSTDAQDRPSKRPRASTSGPSDVPRTPSHSRSRSAGFVGALTMSSPGPTIEHEYGVDGLAATHRSVSTMSSRRRLFSLGDTPSQGTTFAANLPVIDELLLPAASYPVLDDDAAPASDDTDGSVSVRKFRGRPAFPTGYLYSVICDGLHSVYLDVEVKCPRFTIRDACQRAWPDIPHSRTSYENALKDLQCGTPEIWSRYAAKSLSMWADYRKEVKGEDVVLLAFPWSPPSDDSSASTPGWLHESSQGDAGQASNDAEFVPDHGMSWHHLCVTLHLILCQNSCRLFLLVLCRFLHICMWILGHCQVLIPYHLNPYLTHTMFQIILIPISLMSYFPLTSQLMIDDIHTYSLN